MGTVYSSILPNHEEFIRKQRLFFVGSAPLSADGHVNISPKGHDVLRIFSPNEVAYLDLTGSGNETSAHLKEADGVLICTPEYAKGVPGSLKNALDWIVSSGEFVNKPVAVISASPHPDGGSIAMESILGTLSMMGAAVVAKEGALTIPFVNKKLGYTGEILDKKTELDLKTLLDALIRQINDNFERKKG